VSQLPTARPANAPFIDLYRLTMLQAHFDEGPEPSATCERFVRRLKTPPRQRGSGAFQ
jgi:nicotinic acid phosphoribosyltransferase